MEKLSLICFLLLCASCSSYPRPILPAHLVEIADHCTEYVGSDWARVEPPANARELAAMATFHVRPIGFLWFTSTAGDYAACAYTRDPDGCGYSAHIFTKQNKQWQYMQGKYQDRICVVGQRVGT